MHIEGEALHEQPQTEIEQSAEFSEALGFSRRRTIGKIANELIRKPYSSELHAELADKILGSIQGEGSLRILTKTLKILPSTIFLRLLLEDSRFPEAFTKALPSPHKSIDQLNEIGDFLKELREQKRELKLPGLLSTVESSLYPALSNWCFVAAGLAPLFEASKLRVLLGIFDSFLDLPHLDHKEINNIAHRWGSCATSFPVAVALEFGLISSKIRSNGHSLFDNSSPSVKEKIQRCFHYVHEYLEYGSNHELRYAAVACSRGKFDENADAILEIISNTAERWIPVSSPNEAFKTTIGVLLNRKDLGTKLLDVIVDTAAKIDSWFIQTGREDDSTELIENLFESLRICEYDDGVRILEKFKPIINPALAAFIRKDPGRFASVATALLEDNSRLCKTIVSCLSDVYIDEFDDLNQVCRAAICRRISKYPVPERSAEQILAKEAAIIDECTDFSLACNLAFLELDACGDSNAFYRKALSIFEADVYSTESSGSALMLIKLAAIREDKESGNKIWNKLMTALDGQSETIAINALARAGLSLGIITFEQFSSVALENEDDLEPSVSNSENRVQGAFLYLSKKFDFKIDRHVKRLGFELDFLLTFRDGSELAFEIFGPTHFKNFGEGESEPTAVDEWRLKLLRDFGGRKGGPLEVMVLTSSVAWGFEREDLARHVEQILTQFRDTPLAS